jgi:hypothetical protein
MLRTVRVLGPALGSLFDFGTVILNSGGPQDIVDAPTE